MTIHFKCPYCQKSLRAPEKAAGRTASWTKCKKKLIVPEKKEVLVPGKDGKPKKVNRPEPETKPKRKRGKSKSKIVKEVVQLDSEIKNQLQKEKSEARPRSEKEVDEFELEVEKELKKDAKLRSVRKTGKDVGAEEKEKCTHKIHKDDEEPELKLKREP